MAKAKPRAAARPAARPSLMHRLFLPVSVQDTWAEHLRRPEAFDAALLAE